METKFNLKGSIQTTNQETQSPFREVEMAANFLKALLSLTSAPYYNFRFEELETPESLHEENSYIVSFSYCLENKDKLFENFPQFNRIRKTVFIKNDEITQVIDGSILDYKASSSSD